MTPSPHTHAVEAAAFRKKPVTIHAVQWDGTPTPPVGQLVAVSDFDLRGLLASKLTCWHRLTSDEADNLIDFVRSAGQLVAGGWQPIETAPRDGTRVLICKATDADENPMGDSFGLFVHRAAWWAGDEAWIVYNSDIRERPAFFEPTHWMPLPPPPAHGINPAPSDPSGYHDPQRIAAWNAANPDAPTHQKEGKP